MKLLKLNFQKIEQQFLIIFLLFGIIWSLVVPPFQSPDEYAHFYRSFMISEGNFNCDQSNGSGSGGNLPISIKQFLISSGVSELPFHTDHKLDRSSLKEAKNIPWGTEREFTAFDGACVYSPIVYVPQSLGIFLGKLFHFTVFNTYYFAKILNFLAFACAVFYSIKWIPRLKWTLFLLVLMPMTLFQSVSVSADVTTVSAAILLVSFILKLAYSDEKVRKGQIVFIVIFSLLVSMSKIAYAFIPLFYFILPKEKIGNAKWYYGVGILSVIPGIVINLLYSLWTKHLGVVMPVDTIEMVKKILHNPFDMISRLFHTILLNDAMYIQFFGVLGWLDTPLPYLIGFGFIMAFVYSIMKEQKAEWSTRHFLISSGVTVITVCCVCTLLYIGWYQNEDKIIDGIQGRYFTPVVLCLFYALYQGLSVIKKWIYPMFITFIFILSTSILIGRYYGW